LHTISAQRVTVWIYACRFVEIPTFLENPNIKYPCELRITTLFPDTPRFPFDAPSTFTTTAFEEGFNQHTEITLRATVVFQHTIERAGETNDGFRMGLTRERSEMKPTPLS
jgi:hypothetical protein